MPFFRITPASVAVHVLAICVRKCEIASMHTNGQRVPVELQAFVIRTSCRSHNVMTQLAFVPIFGNITLVF